jgi:hypothetical protein
MTQFAKITEVSPDTKLIADGGFTCLREGVKVRVFADDQGKLYVPCGHGRHYLDGQAGDGVYIGLSLAK